MAKILKKVSSTEKLMDSSPADYKAVHKVGKFTSLTKLLPLHLTPLIIISFLRRYLPPPFLSINQWQR